ncbi:hypothetical protein OVS_03875 [Mycoplasma ovis str. Michigan]|uniref:Uncharacterized protein n=1 Tax=Mycoplasma ovis str. Michigan TaxID=1415773 RepID=A0ABM5P203_9MOLU|nr:hypothetical protein [Mycoplasma ovis]AHC40507.1 hypothetical protein OVS_03875 [Mycoplasma ovis str. Michigan]
MAFIISQLPLISFTSGTTGTWGAISGSSSGGTSCGSFIGDSGSDSPEVMCSSRESKDGVGCWVTWTIGLSLVEPYCCLRSHGIPEHPPQIPATKASLLGLIGIINYFF